MFRNAVHKTRNLADVIRFLRSSDGFRSATTRSNASPFYCILSNYTPPMSSTSTLPKSIPIRTPSTRSSNSERVTRLTEQQLDIWEHAALLYHSYEWQAASDLFVRLAREIKHDEEGTLCLLNAGLIQARLGNYSTSASMFDVAARSGPCNLIAGFLLAVINHELRDFSKAETCIELCLDDIGHDAVDHSDLGLKFVLDRALLQYNLRAVRQAQSSADSNRTPRPGIPHVASLPAECIFEAPQRCDLSEGAAGPAIKPMSPAKRMWCNKMGIPIREPSTREQRIKRSATFPDQTQRPMSPLSQEYSAENEPPSENEDTDPTSSSLGSSPAEILAFSPPTTGSSYGSSDRRPTQHTRPKTPYTPRPARVDYESTKDLERCIRRFRGPKALNLTPRDPRGEYESMDEIANFATHYAPERSRDSVVEPLIRDEMKIAEHRQRAMLNKHYDSPVTSPGSDVPTGYTVSNTSDAPAEYRPLVFSGHSGPGGSYAHQRSFNETRSETSILLDEYASSRRWSEPCLSAMQADDMHLENAGYKPPLPVKAKDPAMHAPPARFKDKGPAIYVPPSKPKDHDPAVYVPPPNNFDEESVYSNQGEDSPEAAVVSIFDRPTSPLSLASSYASSTRREEARGGALAQLEGRKPPEPAQRPAKQVVARQPDQPTQRTGKERENLKPTQQAKGPRKAAKPATDKPLPPRPRDGRREDSPPRGSVETVNFFDTVLRTEKGRGPR